jgi:tetratricopeptide (TPR) repeat protein/predicted AlkP superfamily pyrophosphatase or phosphodiesterase
MKTVLIIVGVIVAVAIAASLEHVPGGQVGALEDGGQVRTLDPGLYLRLPWKRATLYPVEPERVEVQASSPSPGGEFRTRIGLDISVSRDHVAALYRSYGDAYLDDLIAPLVKEYLRRNLEVSSSYPEETLTDEVGEEMLAVLNGALGSYGIKLHSLFFQSLEVVENPEDARIMELARRHGGKVVIIGSDGFDWQIYRQVSKQIPMPNLERLIQEGCTGDLRSMEPMVSPMIWTTMATGVEPHVHGIIDFVMEDAATGESVPITSTMRRVPALWNILSRYGISSGFVGWLGTYPAEAINGFMVSDRIVFHAFDPRWQEAEDQLAEEDTEGLAFPDSLINEIRPFVLTHEDIGVDALRGFIDVSSDDLVDGAGTFDPLDPVRNLRLILAANQTYEQAGKQVYSRYRPVLFSVYLDLVDTMGHLFIKHMEPATSDVSAEDARKYRGAMAAAYSRTDSIIGEWMDLIDDETTLVMISDHGFKSGDIRPSGPSAIGGGQAVKWHRMAGAIAFYGHRVNKGEVIMGASVLDVAPTVLRLLGLPAADDMPGRVLEEAFNEGWLASSSEIGAVESYGTRGATGEAVRREDEEAAMLERLRALGYVGGGSADENRLAGSYFSKGEFDKAIEIWQEELRAEPDNPQVLTYMANALLHKGEVDDATSVLEGVIEKHPEFVDARNMLSMCYINARRLADAERIALSVLALEPGNGEAHFSLGVIADQRGRHDEALSAFKRSVELRGDYDEARFNLANEYFRRGNFKHAKIQACKAIDINPDFLDAWYLLGQAYKGLRNADSAKVCFREALKRAPGFNRARVSLAITLAAEGRLEDAKEELERGLGYPDDLSMIYINLGLLHRQIGDLDAAEENLKKAVDLDRTFLPARLDLANLYVSQGETGKARRELEEILEIDPTNQQARQVLGQLR